MKSKKEVFGHEVYNQHGKWYYRMPWCTYGPFKSFNQAYSEYRRRIKKK